MWAGQLKPITQEIWQRAWMVHLSTWNESQLYFSSCHYFPLLQYPSTSRSQRLYFSILACRWFQLFSKFLIFSFISAVFLSLLILWFYLFIYFLIRQAPIISCVYKTQGIFFPVLEATACLSPQVSSQQCLINCLFFSNTFPFFAWKTNINPKVLALLNCYFAIPWC